MVGFPGLFGAAKGTLSFDSISSILSTPTLPYECTSPEASYFEIVEAELTVESSSFSFRRDAFPPHCRPKRFASFVLALHPTRAIRK